MAKKNAAAKKQEAAPAETQAVATQAQASLPAQSKGIDSAWGGEQLGKRDMLVPKLLLMQGLSKLVADSIARSGEIRDSLEGNLIGGMTGPKECKKVRLIPFGVFKTWVVFEKKDGNDEYAGTLPITAENEGLPIEEVKDGVQIRRDYCLNFYVLRPEDIEAGATFPYVVSFRRTSLRAGKTLATLAAKLKVFNRPLASKYIALGVEAQENEKGKFFAFTVEQGADTEPKHLAAAYDWHKALQTATVKVDDSDLKAEAAAKPSAGAPDGVDY